MLPCIYCRRVDVPRTEEHVLPRGARRHEGPSPRGSAPTATLHSVGSTRTSASMRSSFFHLGKNVSVADSAWASRFTTASRFGRAFATMGSPSIRRSSTKSGAWNLAIPRDK